MKGPTMSKECRMEVQTAAERKMTLAQKRKVYRCDTHRMPCSNCPFYKPAKK